MSLHIAFDLDGVLADMDAALVREAAVVFGEGASGKLQDPDSAADSSAAAADGPEEGVEATDLPATATAVQESAPAIRKLNLTPRQERKLWRHVASVENFWETLDETEPGLISRIDEMARERRWEVIFLTKRPKTIGATAQVQSQRWLVSKGFSLPSVYVVQGNRGRIAAALGLDVVIDDRPENCLDVTVDSKARAILVWRDDEKTLPPGAKRMGIGVVRTVQDCLEILTTLDKHATEPDPGLLARVRKMLGLKEAAGV